MKFHSTRSDTEQLLISEAMMQGLAPDGGLFIPDHFPKHLLEDFNQVTSYPEFAYHVLKPYFQSDELADQLEAICHEAFNFELPIKILDTYNLVLELFHGPTLSFKDFGARFLASCLSRLATEKPFTILVATSGDTGSAVAAAFHNKPNIRVVVLYPKGKISLRQQQQITCWGDNVLAVAVHGSFDDCQQLVKNAFEESWWQENTKLNTANSINIGRLLPQSTYYAYSSWQYFLQTDEKANFIVPSGNIGNVSAAYWAKQMGFPIEKLVLSQNANNIVGEYIETGAYTPKKSIETLANAMDVGSPSNFERLLNLYPNFDDFIKGVKVISSDDNSIKETIRKVYQTYNEIICPHTATAFYARSFLAEDKAYIIVATAHPAKFEQVIEPVLSLNVPAPHKLQALIDKKHSQVEISPNLKDLSTTYRQYFDV
ncbi:threonine synthase [Thiotrichales bacterium 19S9-12]|nr:threonine synthase [Thiotrichales bacterium 19S9-11]MCF6812238.1 threonine synthase [Thiotrichales bacterium 19S9-12]